MKRGLTEDIALGKLGLEGSFEIQITNPLTGRPYYNRSYHNLVTNHMYGYLKQMCIASLSSMENSNAGLDLFSQGNPYCASSGNVGYLRSPICNVFLTDGTQAAQANRSGIDGTIIARAGNGTRATSGTVYGVLDTSTLRTSSSGVTKRWDWASPNGNGTMTKLCLATNYSYGRMQLSGGLVLPINSLNTFLKTERNAMYIRDDCIYLLTWNGPTSVTITKNTVSISDLTVHTANRYNITLPVELVNYGGCSLFVTADHRYLYFCGDKSTMTSVRYYRYDTTTGAVTASGEYETDRFYNSGAAYGVKKIWVGSDGEVRILIKNNTGSWYYKLYTLHSDGTSTPGPVIANPSRDIGGYSVAEDSAYFLFYGTLAANTWVFRINKSTGALDGYDAMLGTGHSDGYALHLCSGGVNYAIVCTDKFTHAEPMLGNFYDPWCFVTTEKRFTEPITKADMPMFVQYTLNIV